MTDQNLESVINGKEDGQPSPATSPKEAHNSSSANPKQDDFGERIKRIEKMVETMQSGKDKGVNKALNEVGELRKTLGEMQRLIKGGLSEDEAFEAIENRKAEDEFKNAVLELRDAIKGGKPLPVQANRAQGEPSVIEKYGMDANDPEVIASVLTQTDPKDAELAALRLMHKRSQSNSQPSAASPATGAPPPVQDDGQKIARLNALQKEPSKNRAEIRKLEKELGW